MCVQPKILYFTLRQPITMARNMSDKMKPSNKAALPTLVPKSTRMKSISISRFIFPLFLTVAFMACLLNFSISDGLSSLEQNNPVLLALREYNLDHHDMGPSTRSMTTSTTAPSGTDLDSDSSLRGLGLEEEQSPPVVVVEPIPNPEPADGHDTFSACMLVMDDNHRLVEWLAYHYHVLPLRYLIVAVDPRSKTSPTALFNRWRAQGMYIQEWNDRDFWRQDLELKPIADDAELQTKRDRHRGRQKFFYRRCLMELKTANRTYVTLNDSDEFVVYNHAGGDQYEDWENKMQARHDASDVHGKLQRIKPSGNLPPPTTGQAGAMIEYIRHEKAADVEYYQSPCIGIPRIMFGAQESKALAVTNDAANTIDVDRLDTLRWRHHAHRNDFVKNALGKVIMDVSLIDIEKSPNFMSLHRPIKTICKAPWHNDWESGLRINHYLGSWESYSFRDDSRRGGERSREQWEYKATTNGEETDDNIRPWLDGFVQEHGPDKAKELLDGAGLPDGYQNTNVDPNDTRGWGLLPDKLDKILSTDKTVANDNKMVAFDAWVREKYKNTNVTGSSSSPER